MITLEQNPPDLRAEYLAGLNVCFPGWGGKERFEWALKRTFDGQAPDVLVVRDDGNIVAGTGVSYRNLFLGNTETVRVGIMTGSWTLPSARRRGHFQRMIEESQRCARERDANALLAFVTATNPSYRRLVTAGAIEWETFYLASPQESTLTGTDNKVIVQTVSDVRAEVERILERTAAVSAEYARFVYGVEDWLAQFFMRPSETELVRLGDDGAAVVEREQGIERILALLCPTGAEFRDALKALAKRAAEGKRRLMFFTSVAEQGQMAEHMGMELVRGYLMALPVMAEGLNQLPPTWKVMQWDVQSGDRM